MNPRTVVYILSAFMFGEAAIIGVLLYMLTKCS